MFIDWLSESLRSRPFQQGLAERYRTEDIDGLAKLFHERRSPRDCDVFGSSFLRWPIDRSVTPRRLFLPELIEHRYKADLWRQIWNIAPTLLALANSSALREFSSTQRSVGGEAAVFLAAQKAGLELSWSTDFEETLWAADWFYQENTIIQVKTSADCVLASYEQGRYYSRPLGRQPPNRERKVRDFRKRFNQVQAEARRPLRGILLLVPTSSFDPLTAHPSPALVGTVHKALLAKPR